MRTLMAAVAAASIVGALPALAADTIGQRLAGVWWTNSYSARLLPIDGKGPPFTPEGQAQYLKNIDSLKRDATIDSAKYICTPTGVPRAMTSAYPLQVIMTPGQVTFAYEENRMYRQVLFSDHHADPKIWDPSYMGDGIAKWDGDTLVIETNNIKPDHIYLDSTGLPISPQLKVREQIQLTEDGTELEDLITIDDPVNFTKPWTARRTFVRPRNVKLQTDWVCGEKHRDVSSIMQGIRQ